nr:leucine zipper putative tumor suppressor 2-like [Ipomoea batatas]
MESQIKHAIVVKVMGRTGSRGQVNRQHQQGSISTRVAGQSFGCLNGRRRDGLEGKDEDAGNEMAEMRHEVGFETGWTLQYWLHLINTLLEGFLLKFRRRSRSLQYWLHLINTLFEGFSLKFRKRSRSLQYWFHLINTLFEGFPLKFRKRSSRSLDNAAVKISAEEYEYEIFRSPKEYSKAKLELPRYDLPAKYTPKRAVVTVAVAPPPPDAGSQGTMRSFLVSACPPAPATKISLGSKKAEPSRPADPSAEAPVPTSLPLAATYPTGLSGDQETGRAAKRGKEKEVLEIEEVTTAKRSRCDGAGSTTPVIDVLMRHGDEPPAALLARICAAAPPPEKTSGLAHRSRPHPGTSGTFMAHSVTDLFARAKDGDEIHRRDVAPLKKSLAKRDQRIKELEGKLKTTKETGRRILERADFGEKILTDPALLAKHICRGRETGEAVLAAISRTQVGEDLMYEFRTWEFNKGRRAMQSDVRAALEVSIDDGDLQRVLAVLPEEVPDPGPTPFLTTPEGQVLPVPLADASAGLTAEDAATPNAGQTAEGATGPGVEPSADHP